MITSDKLEKYLGGILIPENFVDYVPNGLQIEGNKEIHRLVSSPSISNEVIDRAIESQAQAILVHHGLFWKNEPRVLKGVYREKIRKILTNDINLFAYHLPLDFVKKYGNNEPVLQQFRAVKITPFANVGYTGFLKKPLDFTEFSNMLDQYFGVAGIHIPRKGKISKIGIVSGNGSDYFQSAIQDGVDAFITGEGTEWIYQIAKDNNTGFSAMGHYRTEWTGAKLLGEHLAKKFNLDFEFFTENNPF